MQKFICIGNLTKDIEIRETPNGKKVAELNIAVKRPYSEETDFFTAVAWEKKAELCAEYLKKGNKVGITGFLYNEKYEDKNGVKRITTKIRVDEVEFLTPKQKDEERQESKEKEATSERPPLEEITGQLPF